MGISGFTWHLSGWAMLAGLLFRGLYGHVFTGTWIWFRETFFLTTFNLSVQVEKPFPTLRHSSSLLLSNT